MIVFSAWNDNLKTLHYKLKERDNQAKEMTTGGCMYWNSNIFLPTLLIHAPKETQTYGRHFAYQIKIARAIHHASSASSSCGVMDSVNAFDLLGEWVP